MPNFIRILYQIVNDPNHKELCTWSQDGSVILIKDMDMFVNSVLPNYFKISRYQSFVRQLNVYSFRKVAVRDNPDYWAYQNNYFKRDNDALLVNMRRQPDKRYKTKGKAIIIES